MAWWRLISVVSACVLYLGACLNTDSDVTRDSGNRGYPCYFDDDCNAPLTCERTLAAPTPVCSGSAGPGHSCSGAVACAWMRDDRGLPLRCGDDGTCGFGSEPFPAPEDPTTQ